MADTEYSLPEEAFPFMLEDDDSSQEPDDDIQDPPRIVEGLESTMGRLNLSNNNNNPETNEMLLNVLWVAKDQWGSRSLLAMIKKGKPEVAEMILSEVKNHVHELMTHPNGHWLVQKIFEATSSVSEEQKDSLVFLIVSDEQKLRDVCMDNHGNRIIQKMLDNIKCPITVSVVVDAMRRITDVLMKNVYGSHVIRHCVKIFPPAYKQVFLDEVAPNCVDIATNKVGCQVIRQCLRQAEGEAITHLVREITRNALVLAEHPYGNFVVQSIVLLKLPSTNKVIIEQLRGEYVRLSMNKHARHVVECLLEFSEPNHADVIAREIMRSNDFLNVVQDPFGSFVAKKAVECTKGPLHGELSNLIFSYSGYLQSHPYGKRVLAFAVANRLCV